MTGRGRGFCVLEVPNEPSAPLTGIAGQAGRPVGRTSASWQELARLRSEARRIEAILIAIRSRIAAFEGLPQVEWLRRVVSGGKTACMPCDKTTQ
jgi:hypothetical protein